MPSPGSDRLARIARKHLPPAVAERWLALTRPRLHLRSANQRGRVVGYLGGVPHLPDDMEWPAWEGEDPLNFVASIDCGRLPTGVLDIPVPDSGTLLFFYFDDEPAYGHDSDFARPRTVGLWD